MLVALYAMEFDQEFFHFCGTATVIRAYNRLLYRLYGTLSGLRISRKRLASDKDRSLGSYNLGKRRPGRL